MSVCTIVFLAVYRRGQTSAREIAIVEEEDMQFESMSEEFDDIPDVVMSDEDLDDDLELLEDLDDLRSVILVYFSRREVFNRILYEHCSISLKSL